ncbi:choice-of-anchor P family protein [Nocardioides sp. CN2-186]|uniref:choice-of-anchor P family protein n=1 Tax=Nocardioides tweenelious TaxID=3156607 RepID=UPI0032B56BA7
MALGLTVAALGTGQATAATTSGHQAAKPQLTPTSFALQTSGYGTRVQGGDIPGKSGTSAYQVISCTNDAGKAKTNHQAESELPGLGTLSAVTTKVWTTQKAGVTSSWSRHSVGAVRLSDSPLGTLLIDAVTTTARAFHDAKGFHTETNTDIGGLTFKPAAGPAQTLPIPAPGNPTEIPGFGTVTIGHSNVHKHRHSAGAYANGLKVELTASHSTVRIAHAFAKISDGIISGLFSGSAAGLSGKLGGETLDLGRNPLSVMPCKGTGGKVQQKTLAGASGQDQVTATGLHNEQRAEQTQKKAWGFERSTVASFKLGDQLSIKAIVGQANVTRTAAGLNRSIKGTQVGTITANGQDQTFPDTDTITIPGVAKIERGVVTKTPGGIKVVGVRITLLDGSGGVIDLATAKLRIAKPSKH